MNLTDFSQFYSSSFLNLLEGSQLEFSSLKFFFCKVSHLTAGKLINKRTLRIDACQCSSRREICPLTWIARFGSRICLTAGCINTRSVYFRCRTEFTTFVRQHHCRHCGQSFCAKCSSKVKAIPKFGIEKEVRVCDSCFDILSGKQSNNASSAGSTVNSTNNMDAPSANGNNLLCLLRHFIYLN